MSKYAIEITKSGYPTLLYNNNGKIVRIHSAYDPVKEATNAVEDFSPKRASIIVVCGLGLGYHIQALSKAFPHHTIITIEKDRELTAIVKEQFPDVLSLCPVVHSEEEIASFLETLDIRFFKGTSLFVHRPSYILDAKFYDAMTSSIHKQLSSKISDLLTRFEFEELWVTNILLNTFTMHNATPVQPLFGKFKGIPGIIVSAGPSLVHSLDALAHAYDKALIVCVDTAYKVLERHGVLSHIVMTLDAQSHSIKHFLGLKSQPLLLADVVSCPKVTRLLSHRIYSTTAKYYTAADGTVQRESTPLMEWVQKFTGEIGDIQSGGSVATSAFDLLLNAGCSSIVLVGQDLAYTGREIHSRGTHHNDDWLPTIHRFKNLDTINQNVIRKRKIKYVPSNEGDTVITDFVLDLYRSWFEDSARKVSIPVYNTSSGGAVIAHTHYASLETLVKGWKTPTVHPQAILESVLSTQHKISTTNLRAKLSSLYKTLHELHTAAKENNTVHMYTLLDDDDIDALLTPFLRKTLFYIARHSIEQSKIDSLLRTACEVATTHLLKIFKKLQIQ